ncbi:cobalt/nickel transport system permease protein [Halohasta litchfieldiae]|uniref:Cobalt/nickel transport system permease protein n=1 Tax=Halohasta litchfieldiae TaxID=1073996 RepID=A0A1H6UN80_9EURY|nr:cobalt ECF transporter T component CbiQ [Halohasta litchfieldiae]ATW87435.1 cobalt/nickel transport system permease protein [Halohasta litchfieldiae]SEI89680.1 cobalt/nickel transport system permease protein [Halohasta litchfieldiae]
MTGTVADSAETISGHLRRFFTAEQIAAENGLLQQRDPRVSLLSIAGLALAVMLSRRLAVVCLFAGVTLLLARLSKVPLRRLLGRSAVVPLFSGLIVLPQIVLLPGEALVGAYGFTITDAGLGYLLFFTLRVGVGVALLSLLVLTTPFSAIVAAMSSLRIPVALVWVIAITYRYLFLFFDELQRLVLARNSRSTGSKSYRAGWDDLRRIAGTFLLRTLDRGERVGRGMRARGGARPPSPYSQSTALDISDYALLSGACLAIVGSGVVRWGL